MAVKKWYKIVTFILAFSIIGTNIHIAEAAEKSSSVTDKEEVNMENAFSKDSVFLNSPSFPSILPGLLILRGLKDMALMSVNIRGKLTGSRQKQLV